jgi:hypothetical protein
LKGDRWLSSCLGMNQAVMGSFCCT